MIPSLPRRIMSCSVLFGRIICKRHRCRFRVSLRRGALLPITVAEVRVENCEMQRAHTSLFNYKKGCLLEDNLELPGSVDSSIPVSICKGQEHYHIHFASQPFTISLKNWIRRCLQMDKRSFSTPRLRKDQHGIPTPALHPPRHTEPSTSLVWHAVDRTASTKA